MTYTISRETELTPELREFLVEETDRMNASFGHDAFDISFALVVKMIREGVFLVCRRHGEITGFHVSWIFRSPLDVNVRLIQQQAFYVAEDSGRTAYHLFKYFIDFGKREADHIITMVASKTNIKPATLKRWGFEELETLYKLEVK